jgi:cobalt/nickel transport system permease protein
MHIPDGVLSLPVLAGGGLVTAAALAKALPSVSEAALPKVAVVSALFFVVSLISVPVGPTSVHLVLSTLMGLVLGWAAVPAVFIGLVLQAVFFGFGGLTTLGVTTATIALPALCWAMVFRGAIARSDSATRRGALAALAAGLSIATSAGLVIAVLGFSDPHYLASAPFVAVTYLPLLAAEALITGFAVGFLSRVRPETLALAGVEARNV